MVAFIRENSMTHTAQRSSLAALLTGLGLLVCTGLAAQPMIGHAHGPGMWQPGGDRYHEHMQGLHEQHLATLKAQLQLTDAQQEAWREFAQAHQPPARPPRPMDPAEWARLKTPERLDKMQAWMEQQQATRQAHWQQQAQATRKFYAQLSPAQQQVFDAQTGPRHGPGQPPAPRKRPND
jgi:hypothetical protein